MLFKFHNFLASVRPKVQCDLKPPPLQRPSISAMDMPEGNAKLRLVAKRAGRALAMNTAERGFRVNGIRRSKTGVWTILQDALFLCLIGGISLYAVVVGAAALGSAAGFPSLVEPLAVLDGRLPVIFRLHMVGGGLGLILLPGIIFLRRRKKLHRPLGRAGLILLLAAALAALPSALASVAAPLARAGFFTQGVLTIYFLTAGFRAIRRKDRAAHRRLMLCAASLAGGAIVLRLMLYCAGSLELDPDAAYAAIAWISWGIPLALAAALTSTVRLSAVRAPAGPSI
jgi:uncharacterized membrane protein